MHTYRALAFPPWTLVAEIPLIVLAAVLREPWMLMLPLAGFLGAFLGVKASSSWTDLRISAEGLRVWGLILPWEAIERMEHRHVLMGGHRLVLRQPLAYPRWLSPGKVRYIGLANYERPIEIGADIARWAPHLLPDREPAHV